MLDLSSSPGFIFLSVIRPPFKVARRIEKYFPLVVNCKSACRREEKNTGCVIVSLALLTMQHIINFHFCCERLGETGRQAGSQVNTKHILQTNNTMDWRGPVLDDLDNFPCVRDQRVERYRDYCVVSSHSAMICTSDIRFYLLHLHQY